MDSHLYHIWYHLYSFNRNKNYSTTCRSKTIRTYHRTIGPACVRPCLGLIHIRHCHLDRQIFHVTEDIEVIFADTEKKALTDTYIAHRINLYHINAPYPLEFYRSQLSSLYPHSLE